MKKYYVNPEKFMMLVSDGVVDKEYWEEVPKEKLKMSLKRMRSMKVKSIFSATYFRDLLNNEFEHSSDIIIKLENDGAIVFQDRYTKKAVLLMWRED